MRNSPDQQWHHHIFQRRKLRQQVVNLPHEPNLAISETGKLRIREPEWFEHRLFKGPDTAVNLHVFGAACEEVDRMLAFRDRLRADAVDRELSTQRLRHRILADTGSEVIDGSARGRLQRLASAPAS